jgi:hypothetical protein
VKNQFETSIIVLSEAAGNLAAMRYAPTAGESKDVIESEEL